VKYKNDWRVWLQPLLGLLFICYAFYRFVTTGEVLGPAQLGFISFSENRFVFVASSIFSVLIFGLCIQLLIKPVKSMIDNFLQMHKKSSHHLVQKKKEKEKGN
jgi:hypothetical protein